LWVEWTDFNGGQQNPHKERKWRGTDHWDWG
jgi:hypothetical protein